MSDNWKPLEDFFGSPDAPELDAFMFVQSTRTGNGNTVRQYKHRDTCWYLQIDDDGIAYRYGDRQNRLIPISRRTALAMVYDGIDDDVLLSSPGSVPRYEVFPMERNKPRAA